MTETRTKNSMIIKRFSKTILSFFTRYLINLTAGKTNRSEKQDKCLFIYFLQKLLFSFRAKRGSWLRQGLIRFLQFWAKSYIGQPSYSGSWNQ